MLAFLMNALHVIYVVIPVLAPTLSYPAWSVRYFQFAFLLYILTPLSWALIDNRCWWTVLTARIDPALKSKKTKKWGTSEFSAVYMWWLYKPLAILMGNEWDKEGLRKAIYLHWMVNSVALWYTSTYILCSR